MTLFHYRESCRYENTVSLLLTYFSQSKLLLHWRGRLARVNFKECPKTAFGLPVMGVFQKSCEFRACGRKPWRLSEAARGRQLVMGSLHTHNRLARSMNSMCDKVSNDKVMTGSAFGSTLVWKPMLVLSRLIWYVDVKQRWLFLKSPRSFDYLL